MRPIKRSIIIEQRLGNSGSTIVNFADNPFLRGKKITGISLSYTGVGIQSGLVNYFVGGTAVPTCFITLVDNSSFNFVDNLPLAELAPISYYNLALNTIALNNVSGIFEFVPRVVNWTKSKLFFPATLLSSNVVAIFNVFYLDESETMQPSNTFLCRDYQFVSIGVLAVANKYYFPDLPNLRQVKVRKISVYTVSALTLDINSVGVATVANIGNSFITLNKGNDEIVRQMPLELLNSFQSDSNYYNNTGGITLDNLIFDFSKSYIEMSVAITPPRSLCFGIFYTKNL